MPQDYVFSEAERAIAKGILRQNPNIGTDQLAAEIKRIQALSGQGLPQGQFRPANDRTDVDAVAGRSRDNLGMSERMPAPPRPMAFSDMRSERMPAPPRPTGTELTVPGGESMFDLGIDPETGSRRFTNIRPEGVLAGKAPLSEMSGGTFETRPASSPEFDVARGGPYQAPGVETPPAEGVAPVTEAEKTLTQPSRSELIPKIREIVIRNGGTMRDVANEIRLRGLDKVDKAKESAPTQLAKLINERAQLKAQGIPDEDPRIKAYDSKISGTDITLEELTPDEIDVYGALMNANGRVPNLGRGKQAAKIRMKIAKSAARQALAKDPDAPPEMPGKTPSEAAFDVLGTQSDTRAIQGSLNFLEKQVGAMGSFVTNMESQVDKVSELSKELETFDTRLLNVPLRVLRGRIAGSPLQAKYDLYLQEIENEIGKLASGSTASVAELSVGAQERWAKIHDKNLSVKDMMSLLEETMSAARMRENSVRAQLDKTRGKMRRKGVTTPSSAQSKFKIISVE